jgi:CBS domain-containing protein
MRARDLAVPLPILDPSAPAREAARLLVSEQVDGVLVVDPQERLLGMVTDTSMLAWLLPPYVTEDQALAHVLDEHAADLLWRRLQDRTTRELLPAAGPDVPCEVDAGATVIEVGTVMTQNGLPLVAVRQDGRLLGGITSSRLLTHLLARP